MNQDNLPREGARPSESASGSDITVLNSSRTIGLEHNSEADLNAREVANRISEFWNVDDSLEVVLEFGISKVLGIHRRMKSMSRKQKLNHVDNLGGYFMRCLIGGAEKKKSGDDDYEAYLERQRARGQDV